jgi:hypothetical protein
MILQVHEILGYMIAGFGVLIGVAVIASAIGWCAENERRWKRETEDYYNWLLEEAKKRGTKG